jgi:Costars
MMSKKTRLDEECAQLLVDIRRIGERGEPHVLFGELFDDDDVSNYYEALVGTLKAAKKRGLITFQGQMLLKGPHDKVKITILDAAAEEEDGGGGGVVGAADGKDQ